MIIATAGHVDHGKTSLIRALTNVDTDRLPEEKKRGMTIDLGFAYLPVDAVPGGATEAIGFVDVPGHERFVRNLICGLSAIDFALLVIAADDGPMPQTREHLSILESLGVRAGVVALTKIDRVAHSGVEARRSEIEALLAPTSLAGVPVFPVATTSGNGLEALKAYLVGRARSRVPRPARGNFRLAVDRVFLVPGTGLVVTGTAVSGTVRVGDTVRTSSGHGLRVRSLHVHNRASDAGHAGQRCALNLSGAGERAPSIVRGDWILAGRAPDPVTRFDARLRLLRAAPEPLAHWAPVHVHLGTAHAMARVAVLGGQSIASGGSSLVQIVLERSLGTAQGDHFVIRDTSSGGTIGGGVVADIFPPSRGRAQPSRLAYLAGMENADDVLALRALLEASPDGLHLDRFSGSRNLAESESSALFATVPMMRVPTSQGDLGFSPAHWNAFEGEVLEALIRWHRDFPQLAGLAEDRVLQATRPHIERVRAIGVAREMARGGRIVRGAGTVRLASHRPTIDDAAEALWRRLEPWMDRRALRPPTVHELAEAVGESGQAVQTALDQSARLGRVVRVSTKRYYRPSALRCLGQIFATLAEGDAKHEVSAIAFRDGSGIGRNAAIEVLEFFDRLRFTRRRGNVRTVLRPLSDVFSDDETSKAADSR